MNNNRIAPMRDCSQPPGLSRKIVSDNHYITDGDFVKPIVKVQPDAETRALYLLKQWGFECVQQLDWVGFKDARWVVIEVKGKDLFTPGTNFPYYGIGLNKSQLWLRTQLLNDLGLRTYLINFVPGTNEVYGAYLDELEKGKFYDTPNRIRIYPVDNFNALQDSPNQNLGGNNGKGGSKTHIPDYFK